MSSGSPPSDPDSRSVPAPTLTSFSSAAAGLDARDRRALERLVADLRALHGEALQAVALTGEAASAAYRPRRSPLTVAVLLAEVTPEALRRTRDRVRAWRRRRIATPLLLDPVYVRSSLDVFPLEFLALAEEHALLWGESDPFDELEIDLAHLRLEVEEQLRGKLLHLWEGYLESAGSQRALRRLLTDTPPAFETILRGLLRLERDRDPRGAAALRPRTPTDLLAAVERVLGLELPTFRRLARARQERRGLPAGELEPLFEAYLAEVRRLVRATDAL